MNCTIMKKDGSVCGLVLTPYEETWNPDISKTGIGACAIHQKILCSVCAKNRMTHTDTTKGTICSPCRKNQHALINALNGIPATPATPVVNKTGAKPFFITLPTKAKPQPPAPFHWAQNWTSSPGITKQLKAEPVEVKKAFTKSTNPCECGGHLVGYKPYAEGHSNWCAVSKYKSKK